MAQGPGIGPTASRLVAIAPLRAGCCGEASKEKGGASAQGAWPLPGFRGDWGGPRRHCPMRGQIEAVGGAFCEGGRTVTSRRGL